ncbi:hypothetical protein BT63DRAFT_369857 [Microthyrium microscopicum]|uniref:Uncharacterized protein n=1 Tax=Microthyrium microscopicum TaxID=703497 RepID=A0A6A6UN25_9PEZI|nr:hypothetical protein BT63DRAFT_369857 [Microthyrium microscopicum]
MSSSKRNEWLEADLDDEESDSGHIDQEESRGQSLSHRSAKRRRVDDPIDEDISDYEHESETGETISSQQPERKPSALETIPKLKTTSKIDKKVAKVRDASSRSGVIYISRIPPFMKPHTIKKFLAPYAPSGLGRIFLTPEGFDSRQSRLRGGGNKKRTFEDGWVEFLSKKDAKITAETLNTRTIGGKKGGYYTDDVWNLKYLKGFKWHHLTEQIANENAERSARMRAEGASSRREMNEFLRNVDHSKIEDTRDQKRKAKAQKHDLSPSETKEAPKSSRTANEFQQNEPLTSKGSLKHSSPGAEQQLPGRLF